MVQEEYDSVVADMKLPNGELFGLPVVLDTDEEGIVPGDKLLLTYQGSPLATLNVTSKWRPNNRRSAPF